MKYSIDPDHIEMWVAKYFEFKKRKNGQELLICNPFDDDTKFKFNINTTKGICHDWRPGHQEHDGPFINFVMKFRNLSFHDAIKEVCGDDIDINSIVRQEKKKNEIVIDKAIDDIKLPDSAKKFDKYEQLMERIAERYLLSRGIDRDKISKYRLHYGINKIFFPYYEYDSLVYWQSRSITDKVFEFPSRDSTGLGKEMFLYGFDLCERDMPMYICESIVDAITLGDGAVATGGANMSLNQCRKVKAILPKFVVLTPDNDEAGIMSILPNSNNLRSILDIDIRFCVPPSGYKDWNDMRNANPIEYINNNSKPVNVVNINKILSKI